MKLEQIQRLNFYTRGCSEIEVIPITEGLAKVFPNVFIGLSSTYGNMVFINNAMAIEDLHQLKEKCIATGIFIRLAVPVLFLQPPEKSWQAISHRSGHLIVWGTDLEAMTEQILSWCDQYTSAIRLTEDVTHCYEGVMLHKPEDETKWKKPLLSTS